MGLVSFRRKGGGASVAVCGATRPLWCIRIRRSGLRTGSRKQLPHPGTGLILFVLAGVCGVDCVSLSEDERGTESR